MSHETKPRPAICRALARRVNQLRVVKRRMAEYLGVDPSTLSNYLDDREPPYDIVVRCERFMKLAPGQLWIDAGYVPMPSATLESVLERDPRFTEPWRRMAQMQIQTCLEGSLEDDPGLASIVANDVKATPTTLNTRAMAAV